MPKVMRARKAVKSKKVKNAQPAYALKVAVPKRSAKVAPVTAETIAQLQALAAAGLLPGVSKQAAAVEGGFDIASLLKAFQQIRSLWPLLQGLLRRGDKPVSVPDLGEPIDISGPGEEGPGPAGERAVGRLEAKVFWIARKNKPFQAGGGRYLLSDDGKQRIVSGSDPLQAGDRVCFDVSPYDTEGAKYEGPKPLVLEHRVGGVGEIQQQEENDYTPVVFVPWEHPDVKPGFQGEITYQAAGGGFESKVFRLRVRPWKA